MVEMNLTVNGGIKGTTMDDRWVTEHWVALESFADICIVHFNECIVLEVLMDRLQYHHLFCTAEGTYWTVHCYFWEVILVKEQRMRGCNVFLYMFWILALIIILIRCTFITESITWYVSYFASEHNEALQWDSEVTLARHHIWMHFPSVTTLCVRCQHFPVSGRLI